MSRTPDGAAITAGPHMIAIVTKALHAAMRKSRRLPSAARYRPHNTATTTGTILIATAAPAAIPPAIGLRVITPQHIAHRSIDTAASYRCVTTMPIATAPAAVAPASAADLTGLPMYLPIAIDKRTAIAMSAIMNSPNAAA